MHDGNTYRDRRDEIRERRKELKERRKAHREHRKGVFTSGSHRRSGSVLAGLLLLVVGSILIARQTGVNFPDWLFTWPMILVAFGLFAGAGSGFRDAGWVIITGVGVIFLLNKVWPNIKTTEYIWPVAIIAVGMIMITAPRRRRWWGAKYGHDWRSYDYGTDAPVTPAPEPVIPEPADTKANGGDNWLEVVSIFGNIKKLVYSKNFKGGDIVSVFAGAEINLTQADFNGQIVIEVVQIFGGCKLIVPPHWQIRSEMVAIFGGIEDKRTPQTTYDTDKVVILNGTTLFGGIEIKSY